MEVELNPSHRVCQGFTGGWERDGIPFPMKKPRGWSAVRCERGGSFYFDSGECMVHLDWPLTTTWLLVTASAGLFCFVPLARLFGA
jgi:hypothetical protein